MVPAERFPELDKYQPLPKNTYAFFASRFGVTVRRATERLKAVLPADEHAVQLGCTTYTPVLQVERIATALTERQSSGGSLFVASMICTSSRS